MMARTRVSSARCRAAALAGGVAVIAALNFLIIGAVASGGDDQMTAVHRTDAVRAVLGIESASAILLGELNAGRPIPTGEMRLPTGHRVHISSDAELPPMEVELESSWGQATRVVRIRID